MVESKTEKNSFTNKQENGTIVVEAGYEMPDVSAKLYLTYVINNTGEIKVTQKMVAGEAEKVPDMFRFGMQMQMPDEFYRINYYGRGPVETIRTVIMQRIWEFIVRRWLNNSIHISVRKKRVLRLIYVGGDN